MGGCYGKVLWAGGRFGWARTSALLMVFCWTRLRIASRSIPSATVSRAGAGMAAAVATIIAAIMPALILRVSIVGWVPHAEAWKGLSCCPAWMSGRCQSVPV
jgi:hypothetical protein